MADTTQRTINRIPKHLNIEDTLHQAGYRSVFDIIGQSKLQFVSKHKSQWGSKSEEIYDIAQGYANQIRRIFRKNKVALATQQKKTSVAATGGKVQGLLKNGPTWQNLFQDDWSSYCLSSAPEANDSPVSYLSWLYNQALEFESQAGTDGIVTLEVRRPDLPALMLDTDAINQVIPSLQLVNEVLEQSVLPYVDSLDAESTVDETLAVTRYPTLLPYHYPHQQTLLSLDAGNESLQDTMKKTDLTWPWFTKDNLLQGHAEMAWQLGSDLAPEQQNIMIETDNSTGDLSAFYKENIGLEIDSYSSLTDADVFCAQLGISSAQLEGLFCCIQEDTTVVVSKNVSQDSVNSADYGAKFINSNLMPALAVGPQPISWDTDGADANIDVVSGNNMTLENVSWIQGEFGTAIEVDATQNSVSAYFSDDFSYNGTDLLDFTLTFWCKVDSDVKNLTLITTNKTETYAGSSQGITLFITVDSDNKTKFQLETSDGSKEIDNNNYIDCPFDTWIFVALVQDSENKKLYGYFCTDSENLQSTEVDFTDNPNIGLKNTFWGFNGNKANNYYSAHADRKAIVSFDDIAVWDRQLTVEELNPFVTLGEPVGGRSDMKHYYPLNGSPLTYLTEITSLSDSRMDRINRMVRMQRWLDLPYDKIDLLVTSVMKGTITETNTNTLRMLSVFKHYQQNYVVGASQFAAVLYRITPYAIAPEVPFFDQVFNSPSLFEGPFTITDATFDYTALTEGDGRIVKQICAGLGINRAQFLLLAQQISAAQSDGSTNLSCSLDVVSAFYRLVMVPRWLGLNFSDGLALLKLVEGGKAIEKLAAIPVYAALDANNQPTASDLLDTLMALADAVSWLADNNLSALKVLALLQSDTGNMPATTAELNFITEINQQLPATLLNEQSFSGLPQFSGPNTHYLTLPAGYTTVQGAVTQSAVQVDSSLGQYGIFSQEGNALANGSSSYTLGGWCYVGSGATNNSPLLANATISSDKTAGPGIAITLGSSYNLDVTITDDIGSTKNTAQANWGANSKWFYLAVVLDTSQKSLTVYALKNNGSGVTKTTLDYSDFTGSILMPDGNVWAFNQDGDLTYYTTFSSAKTTFIFDDINLWQEVLTEDQILEIAQSGQPVAPEDEGWMGLLSNLIDSSGLVLPSATDYNTILSMVQADISTVVFDESVDLTQLAAQLASVIWQAKHSQDGIADSALAKALKVDHSLPPFLLQWAGSSEYSLLNQSLALNAITSVVDIPDDYLQLLHQTARRAGICTTFGLSPAMLFTFLNHPDWFGVADNTIDINLMYLLSRYADWLKLTTKEDEVLAYLRWGNGDALPTADNAATALAVLLDWDSGQVKQAAAYANSTDLIAQNLTQVDTVMRLKTLCTATNTSVETVLNISALSTASDYSAWQTVGESLIAVQA